MFFYESIYISNLPYSDESNSKKQLDLYIPNCEGKKFPLIIYIHGGGWTDRDKEDYKHIGLLLSSQGFICAIINYRLSSQEANSVKHPSHTIDCAEALKWISLNNEKYKIDSNNVYIVGHSAGAFMAALLVFDENFSQIWKSTNSPLFIKSIIGIEGIYDLPTILEDYPDYLAWVVDPAFGKNPKVYSEASPTTIIKRINNSESNYNIPWIIVWSEYDELVNKRQGDDFSKALNQHSITNQNLVLTDSKEFQLLLNHHGIIQKEGFEKYILPIIIGCEKNSKLALEI